LNVVYTLIPCLNLPEANGGLVTLPATGTFSPACSPYNYYVNLADDVDCGERRLLWPIVWMIGELINRLSNRFSGTGSVTLRFNLNILSKELIKAPAQAQPTLNTGGPANGPCICDSLSAATYDYVFVFNFVGSGSAASTLSSGSVTFSAPNNPNVITFSITPSSGAILTATNFVLNAPVQASSGLIAILFSLLESGGLLPLPIPGLLSGLIIAALVSLGLVVPPAALLNISLDPITGEIVITFSDSSVAPLRITLAQFASVFAAGSIRVYSPAHYISFIPTVTDCDGDNFWIATNLETFNV